MLEVTKETFGSEVIHSELPVILDFWPPSEWRASGRGSGDHVCREGQDDEGGSPEEPAALHRTESDVPADLPLFQGR
jgi:hypothetical protein